ncbi:MAG: hypothetical protein ACYC6L_04780 [Anaerolineae bacterium]
MHPQLIRAILRAYEPSAHTAVIEPEAGPAAALSGLAVLSACRAEDLVPGRRVTALLWPDGGGLVLGPQAVPRATRLLADGGFSAPAADVTLSDAYQDVISVALPAVPDNARLVVLASLECECTAWSANQYCSGQLLMEGSSQAEGVERVTAQWLIMHLPLCWFGALAAGSRTFKLQARKWTTANTVVAKTRSHLTWQLYA